jgi:asparagine synthetase B (glutamine-hydrolysing)
MGEKFGDWQGSAWWKWLSAAEGESRSMDSFTRISWLESRSYLVNTLLRDTDAMSMHHSLEVRVPFLDLPLVEYMLSLPQASKSGRGRSKALLIEALGDVLPEEIVEQRKRTFTFPWNNWLRGPLRARVAGGLADWSPALERFSGRANVLVAAVELVRAERMGEAASECRRGRLFDGCGFGRRRFEVCVRSSGAGIEGF